MTLEAKIGGIELHHGDCIEVMRTLADASVDSIVTDPPYELGFMGKAWDGTGIAFNTAVWVEAMRVLKPGGHLLAFGGSRTYHRMACAIEDAGFEVRDQIMWIYGSGFPKSHNGEWGGTALKPAHEPICMARKPLIGTVASNWTEHGTGALNIDACRIPTGETLKVGAGTTFNTIHKGEGRRIGAAGWGGPMKRLSAVPGQAGKLVPRQEPHSGGRWPANVIHDGSDEVLAAFPNAPGQQGDISPTAPSPKTSNVYGRMSRDGEPSANQQNDGVVGFKMRPGTRRLDGGSASRFFYCAKTTRTDRNEGCEHLAKLPLNWSSGEQNPGSFQSEGADKTSPNNHPTVKPTDLMAYLCRLVTPAGGKVLDMFGGSGSTMKGCVQAGFSGIYIDMTREYIEIAKARITFAIERAAVECAEAIDPQIPLFDEVAA